LRARFVGARNLVPNPRRAGRPLERAGAHRPEKKLAVSLEESAEVGRLGTSRAPIDDRLAFGEAIRTHAIHYGIQGGDLEDGVELEPAPGRRASSGTPAS
jgi:hypothetical protein